MPSKKAQLQMIETIAILIVFFMLVVFGLIFYTKVMKGSYTVKLEEKTQLRAIELAQRASFLPELQCSEENIIKDDCIDLLKLEAASAIMAREENKIHYYDLLEFSTITIKEIYPDGSSYTIYSRPLIDYKNKISTPVPISLYNPKTKTNAFGIMTVDLYTK